MLLEVADKDRKNIYLGLELECDSVTCNVYAL